MRAFAALLVLAGVVVAGCGSSDEGARPEPRLPRALANTLAKQSDAVAARLDAGDSCGAAAEAATLEATALAAIDAGRVPTAFEDELATTVGDLAAGIPCEAEGDEEGEGDGDKGHANGKGKGKGKGHDGNGNGNGGKG